MGGPELRKAAVLICLALLLTVPLASSVTAADGERTCSMLIDFGNGRMEWADVPVTEGMDGFDVFLNATSMLGLSETHGYFAPYGNYIYSVDGYAGSYDANAPYDFWRLWTWDDSTNDWHFSDTLLDGVDAYNTEAIALILVRDPYIGPPVATPDHRDPWISERRDFTNTGSMLSYQATNAEPKWSKDLGNGAVDATVVSAAGRLYAVSSGQMVGETYVTNSTLFCMNIAGEVLWEADVGKGHQVAAPLLWNYTVFVPSADGRLYAFDSETGDALWNYNVGSAITASPLTYRNLIIVAAGDGQIVALRQSGTRVWSTTLPTTIASSPALDLDLLLVGGGDGNLYALAADGGGQQWSADVGGAILGSPTALGDRIAVAFSDGGSSGTGGVAAYTYEGSRLWSTATGTADGSPAVTSDGIVALTSQGLASLSLDGTLRWTTPLPSAQAGSPVAVSGMTFIVTDEAGSKLTAVDGSGRTLWSKDLDPAGRVLASPSISDNVMYLASSDGLVYAYLLDNAQWSMPPVGVFTHTVSGLKATFDASASYGGEGELSFAWDFGDGGTATGTRVEHLFRSGGNHTISLMVTDSAGATFNLTKVVDLDIPTGPGTGPSGPPDKGFPVTMAVGAVAVVLLAGGSVYAYRLKRGRR
ncbi:MAG: PQQ-binding-like beta-propeller repeat protein [Methanomassiliicoccus sp.]|nr:PQQ-binding-like beta-propeller repeat protein [Methanomassiliicoccus sp.]